MARRTGSPESRGELVCKPATSTGDGGPARSAPGPLHIPPFPPGCGAHVWGRQHLREYNAWGEGGGPETVRGWGGGEGSPGPALLSPSTCHSRSRRVALVLLLVRVPPGLWAHGRQALCLFHPGKAQGLAHIRTSGRCSIMSDGRRKGGAETE